MFDRPFRTSRNSASGGWFRVENKSDDEARIDIYDEISWFGVSAQSFIDELKTITADTIALHLNSPGGDVFDGIAIKNALTQHPATVNVTVDGIAASIASVIAMAGDTVEMANGSMMMIHEPFAMAIGSAEDMRKTADALDKMGDNIADIYAGRAGKADWRALMRAETWYTAKEAVTAGLADKVTATPAAENHFDLSIFRNGPKLPIEPSTPDWQKNARLKLVASMQEMARAYAS